MNYLNKSNIQMNSKFVKLINLFDIIEHEYSHCMKNKKKQNL